MLITNEQQKAIDDTANNSVIVACAGSGKTTVLIHKMIKCCEELKKHQGIIGLSFTNKASNELKDRFYKINTIKTANFLGTMDNFFLNEIIRPFLPHLWKGGNQNLDIQNILLDDEKIYFTPEVFKRSEINIKIFNSNSEGFKRLYLESSIIFMPSVNVIALFVIKKSAACRRYLKAKYKFLFVDEYQDTSNLQHLIFLEILKLGVKFTAVGDVNQSIYKWRNAVPENFLSLAKEHQFKKYKLSKNHRCHPSIELYANAFLDSSYNPKPLEEDETEIYKIHINGDRKTSYDKLEKLVALIKNEYKLELSDILITARNKAKLEHYAEEATYKYRLASDDDPLDKIGNRIADLCADLISYSCNDSRFSAFSIYENYQSILNGIDHSEFKQNAKLLKGQSAGIDKYQTIANLVEKIKTDREIENILLATKSILENEEKLKAYLPLNKDELQLINIHKVKGLQFKAVIHLGLEDISFPMKFPSNGEMVVEDIESEKNLHYVAITRAEEICVLVSMDYRVNSKGVSHNSLGKSEFLLEKRLYKYITCSKD